MEKTSAASNEILYIGDSDYDRQCAENAKTAFAAAAWNPIRVNVNEQEYARI